ncbi:hypothetical protein BP00DRAFT_425347 [Aspergillus indologenus CBS 114.80]|uniref:Uncharacterized protein n=1 Tax=Aspergillus indologenus CBS 114.80 TaxID=1450541 RepID=A0A2V5J3J9_9EURO|nr:hypothetical protein BP00DRAFT_425347 [Aspergillus indologenus CBS 114.80]
MDDLALKKAFRKTSHYSQDNAPAAIRGQSIPHAVGHRTIQLCLVRGIRYHPGSATELRCKHDSKEYNI